MVVHEPVPGITSLVKKVRNLIVHPLPKTITPPEAHIIPQTIETIAQRPKPKDSSPLDLPKSTIRISGKEQRRIRMAEYERRKAIQKELESFTDSKPRMESSVNTIISPPKVTISQEKSDNLPSGFKEIKKSDAFFSATKRDMPWLKEDENIPLVEITLRDTGEKTFYFGDCIRGKSPVKAEKMLDKHQSKITNNLLYSHLPTFIQKGSHPFIKLVDDTVTNKPIYCVYNRGGNRAYFMRFDDINGKPVIIRVAVCDKAGEGQLLALGALTRSSQKVIKRAGKL